MNIAFGLLGAVEAYVDGRRLDVGHARQQCVLAALLIDADQSVPVDTLMERIWEDRDHRATSTLYSYISRLRRLLDGVDDASLLRTSGGYLFSVDPLAIDLHRFRQLVRDAREATDRDRAIDLYDQATALWRGEAFATLDLPWLNAARDTLTQDRLAAELDRDELRLRAGQHASMLADLTGRAARHPLHERVTGQLMLALYRSGRQANALGQYDQLRHRLGGDPSPPLRRLHRQILAADPALTTTPALS
jgi:DNA-binding SARP family transcriptional activator